MNEEMKRRSLKQVGDHLHRSMRATREAADLAHEIAEGREPHPEPRHPHKPRPFRPVSPARDRSGGFGPSGPGVGMMKPSRMPQRGRHGMKRRRR